MSKLNDYLNLDISKLVSEGNYKEIRKVEKYLNTQARQRVSRLEKANVSIGDNRILSKYSTSDFQSTYISKYKPTNEELKKYNNKMLKSIGNARHFLNLKTSKVKAFKEWTTKSSKNGMKFMSQAQKEDMYRLWNLLKEIDPNGFGSWGSEEQEQVTYYMSSGKHSKLSDTAYERYKSLSRKLRNAGKETINYQIYESYIKRNALGSEYFKPKYDKYREENLITDELENVDISTKESNWKIK